ncbi:UDP-glucose:glycoprotein glucosyltransferase-like isoform X1 [Selaginella moellendorffii]|uniref:UDP-glucose:glycoprotein glucosyltransferase-like isoform X1 n=1 Tax=Selaginella moellendorffii TaxID=88036 RepID=UPI000D1CCFA2|nr:UDP-glucose:glycoprotein glucosyltransferase-like isoform X1 [Selaginella moellendorffii]|eukprot:XP_024522450.1 UDP-glucose:glycoprotein glucosyltransferase-like isoform X1 [Selaginella moellendorffii]
MSKALLPLLAWVAILVLAAAAAHRLQKNVIVELHAKWSGTSLLLEMGELVAKERDDNFWKFIDSWIEREEKESQSSSNSTSNCLEQILSQGSALLDGHLASLLDLSLSLRSASPKLVVYAQLALESLSAFNLHSEGSDRPRPPRQKCCWVDVGSSLLLEESELLHWLKSLSGEPLLDKTLDLFEFDHVYPQSASFAYTAILYGALGTPCFKRFHSILSDSSKTQDLVRYVARPFLPDGCEESCSACSKAGVGEPLNLAGYGVELALKNMEYKAIDDSEVKAGGSSEDTSTEDPLAQEVRGFIFSRLLERKPHLEGELMTFRDQLLSSEISDSMNVWEVKDLGYQAAQRIVGASEPLRLMQELNQNFPNLVSSLSRMKINETIKQEIVSNQQMISPGRNLLAINGALVNPESLDLFTLIHMVHQELSFADKILKMKVPSSSVSKLLRLPEPVESVAVRVDFRSKDFVHYLNDLEEDNKYKRWRTNLNELLMPAFPGQLRYIRKNLYHAVYVLDPVSVRGLRTVEMILHYYHNNLPMRFGLILLSPADLHSLDEENGAGEKDDLSSLMIRLFLYVKNTGGVYNAFEFLKNVLDSYSEDSEENYTEASHIEEGFVKSLGTMTKTSAMEVFSKLKNGEDYRKEAFESSQFVYRLGLSEVYPCLLMNGLVYGESQPQFSVMAAMNEELPKIQEMVYFGQIHSRTDVLDKFLAEEGLKRYNPKIAGTGKDSKYVSVAPVVSESHPVVCSLQYLHTPGTEDDVKPVTHWLVVDLTKESGIRLLTQGVRYIMEGTDRGRLAILHNMKDADNTPESSKELLLPRLVSHVMQASSRRAKYLRLLHSFLTHYKSGTFEEVLHLYLSTAKEMGLDIAKEAILESSTLSTQLLQFHKEKKFVAELFGIRPGINAVATNGRISSQDSKPFIAEDLMLLESLMYRRRIKDVQEIIEDVKWEGLEPDDITRYVDLINVAFLSYFVVLSAYLSTVIMAVSSTMASRTRSSETAQFELLKADHSAIVRHVDGSPIQIDAVINPLSALAQRLTPLLLMLEEWLHPSIRIVLNPMSSLGDVPLKNFYRYVLPSKEEFLSGGIGPHARFSNMPPSKTLTLNLDVPEPWLVEPVVAIHDLDNIVLEKLDDERTLHAVFELEALMITGHCYEHNEPPRGLQLILGTKQHAHVVDTIVMANLGYFQLKAAPGVWTLGLARGRSSELYTLQGHKQGTDEGPISKQILVADMRGELVHLEVVKRRGMEDEKLLVVDDDNGKKTSLSDKTKGFFEWAANIMGTGEKKTSKQNTSASARHGETINIFSVASGHLYERFLKIMMLSVLKNTRRPVKFWFIKNYLSPQFKNLIPHVAVEYGFEYELVTYKWPTWLHKQTEKQRIIWAYKILFLDVIFPLSLKKVIFVDADQIVRADMGELYDMDIKGRPLAYTPFCDNNKDMDGYRFWSQGFWKEHLQGKPYHISALYVVDLDKFRQTAAGDNLRVFYENLSKDPNSLSNLDQDLPNYAQHTVPIYSLPQEWLWCESWCGNATKGRAKTIDLCNNPMTKEPKLQGARRIVQEWPALDEEAQLFTKRILGKGRDEENTMQVPKEPSSTNDADVKDEL